MFGKINKIIIIEYLLKEIDCLTPVEEIYEKYCSDLYNISELNFNLTYSTFRQKFIMKITSMEKEHIVEFCKNEGFIVSIQLIEKVLGRHLTLDDYDYK
tara:strand:+ start:2986 stop:3282 length:297 start_codon:yes stop_codon:yes gene_type:complete